MKSIVQLPIPHVNQLKVLQSRARFVVLRAGRRFGKSLVAQDKGINKMLQGQWVAYITPTFSLAKKFYKTFLKKLPKDIVASSNSSDLEIYLISGGMIKFFSGEAIDNMRGLKFHFVIVDEAAFLKDFKDAWNNVIRPTLTDYRGGALFISTPRGKNFFYALCMRGRDPLKLSYEEFHFSTYDNPHISKAEIDEAKAELPKDVFDQEYEAIASANAANPFNMDIVDKQTRTELSKKPPVIYGIDVAKVGDASVIYGLDEDRNLAYFDRFRGAWQNTRDKILALPARVNKVMDASGVGDVLYENALEMGASNLIGHKFTNSTKMNMVYQFVKDLEDGLTTVNEETAEEMSTYEYKLNARTHTLTFNAQEGFHDDTISAGMLANAYAKEYGLVRNWKLSRA